MAKFKAKTRNCQLNLKASLSFSERINDVSLDFFSRKNLRGLLKIKLTKKRSIEYYGPVAISLQERLKQEVSKHDFFFMIEQVLDISEKIKANALSLSCVVWDIRHVYINETTKEMQFIYLPLDGGDKAVNLMGFLEQIIYAAKPMHEKDMDYISRFVYYLNSLSAFDISKIENFITREDRTIVNTIKRHNVGQSGFMTDKPKHYYEHYEEKEENRKKFSQLDNYEELTGLLDDEATGLLNDYDEEATGLLIDEEATGLLDLKEVRVNYAKMRRISTDDIFEINKEDFRIGKERSYSDYCVLDNNMVSRKHAQIITRAGNYYILDLGSKNGTYVNGNLIAANEEYEIHDMDIIKLANEEFEFRV